MLGFKTFLSLLPSSYIIHQNKNLDELEDIIRRYNKLGEFI